MYRKNLNKIKYIYFKVNKEEKFGEKNVNKK